MRFSNLEISWIPTYNVDVVHVSCRDFLSNLRYQVQSELNVVRLAGFRVYIPFRENTLGLMKGKARHTIV